MEQAAQAVKCARVWYVLTAVVNVWVATLSAVVKIKRYE